MLNKSRVNYNTEYSAHRRSACWRPMASWCHQPSCRSMFSPSPSEAKLSTPCAGCLGCQLFYKQGSPSLYVREFYTRRYADLWSVALVVIKDAHFGIRSQVIRTVPHAKIDEVCICELCERKTCRWRLNIQRTHSVIIKLIFRHYQAHLMRSSIHFGGQDIVKVRRFF